jgi:hypothetical protein
MQTLISLKHCLRFGFLVGVSFLLCTLLFATRYEQKALCRTLFGFHLNTNCNYIFNENLSVYGFLFNNIHSPFFFDSENGCSFLHIRINNERGVNNQGPLRANISGRFFAGTGPHISSERMTETIVIKTEA